LELPKCLERLVAGKMSSKEKKASVARKEKPERGK
jgi:hypothetical protein